MQQVTAHSRFWWRALDAHLPAEPQPAPSPRPLTPARKSQSAAPKAAPNTLKLEIPKADRRPSRGKRAKGAAGRAMLAASVIALCSAGAGAAIVTGAIEPRRFQVLMSMEAQDALLGLGFGIDQVSLSGHHFTTDEDIYGALDLTTARTFAEFDATAALKKLEALPWVETAQITRVFPGSLRVDIRERQPAALWSLKGRTYLIDGTGRVLGAAAEPNGWSLPRIAGEGANTEASLLFAALSRHPDISVAVDFAARISGRRWSLVLKNASRIELAADREIEGLEQVAGNPELRRALSGPATIADVRTPGRLTIRLADAKQERRP